MARTPIPRAGTDGCPGMVANLFVGGADRFEAQAEANEARVLAAAASGRWEGLFRRTSDRVERTLGRTVGARLQRRPIGGAIGGAMIQAALGGLFGGKRGGTSVEVSAGAGRGTVVIEGITLLWLEAGSAPDGGQAKAQPSLEHVRAPDRRSSPAPAGFGQAIRRSAGQPLPGNVRARMEQAFGGVDLSGVRVHTGPEAQALARSIHARAFATGNDVFFNQGQFDPHSPRGLALLAHELTHVLQQRAGASPLPGAPSAHGVVAARTLLSPLGRGGLLEAAGASHSERLGGPESQVRRKASAMVRRSASAGASATPSSPAKGGAAPPATGRGQVVIQSLTMTIAEAGAPAAGPSMVTVAGKGADGWAAPGGFAELLSRSAGVPLPQRLNQQLGALLGADFSDVRVHTGEAAAQAAAAIHAEAFAVGRDIYFGAGRWDPTSPRGVALLGHELTHVAQGRGGARTISPKEAAEVRRRAQVGAAGAEAEAFHAALVQARLRDGAPPAHEDARPLRRAVRQGDEVRELHLAGGRVSRKGGYQIAGHDAFERQALHNERAILLAMQGGGPGPVTHPGYVALRASVQGGLRLSRRETPGGPRSRWERFKEAVSERLRENREYWDEVGVAGIQRGGIIGHSQAMLAALFSGINQPELSRAYVEGLASGAVTAVKGLANMLIHPIETAEGMYRLVVHWDETKAGLRQKVDEYIDAMYTDPEKFARMTGELVGQVEVALIGPKVIGGPREVLGAVRTLRNTVPRGRTLYYYTDDVGAAAIAPRGVGHTGQIGRAGAAEVFATPLDPLLGGSRSAMGVFARMVFLGGRLDFVRQVGQLLPRMRIKAAFTQAIGFKGGNFRHIFFTEVETAIARLGKSVFPQYAASGPQQVQVVAQAILTRRETLHALLDGAGMLGTGSNVLIDNTEVPFKDLIESTLEYYGLDAVLHKDRDPVDDYLGGGSPRERRRRGARLGRALELLEEPGLPLELSVRNRLEQALGADLGHARVHTGEAAERLARELGAEAFTIGHTIFMGEGAWKPETVEGLGTLVHEATHVVQADQGRTRGFATPMHTQALEAEAYARERAFVRAPAAPPSRALGAAAAPPPAPPRVEPPAMVVREAPPPADIPAPEAAPVPTRAMRKAKGAAEQDPIQRVMNAWNVSELSREEFLEVCTERVLELLREEIELDAERGATNLAWSCDVPLA